MNRLVTGYKFQDCRLLGHLWFVVPSDWTPEYGIPMTCRCERCNIERRDSISKNSGEVESRRYVYPDGYLFRRDVDGEALPRRTDFRLAWLNREVDQLSKRRRSAS